MTKTKNILYSDLVIFPLYFLIFLDLKSFDFNYRPEYN